MARKSRSKQRGKGVGSKSQSAGKSKGGSRSSAGTKGGSKSGGNKSGSGKSSKSSSNKSSSNKSSTNKSSNKPNQPGSGFSQKKNETKTVTKNETKGLTIGEIASTNVTGTPLGGDFKDASPTVKVDFSAGPQKDSAVPSISDVIKIDKDPAKSKISTDLQDALSKAFENLVGYNAPKKDPAPAPTPTVPGSLPADYKETEAKAFKEADNFKKQQKANQDREAGELSNLPADYKETEEKAFQNAEAFKAKVAADRKAASDLQITSADAEAQYDIDRAAEDQAKRDEAEATYATNRQKLIDQREARRQAEADAREAARLAKAAEDKKIADAKAAKAAADKLAKAQEKEKQRKLEFDPQGRLNEDMQISSAFSDGSGLFGTDIDVGDGVFRTQDQIKKMIERPGDYNVDPNSGLYKKLQEAGKGLVDALTGTQAATAQEQPRDYTGLGLQETFSTKNLFTPKTDEPSISSSLGTGLNIGGTDTETEATGSTARALDPTEPGLSIQEKAARRDAIFRETGVQTYGGTRDVYGYTKSELDKLRAYADESGLSFGSVIGQKGTQYPGQLGVSQEEIDLYNAYQYEDGLVMNSIGQLVTPEQRAIDDADAGDSIGRSIATGFNNLIDKIPIIGEKLPNLKTDYTRAEQDLLKNITPFKSGAKDKQGNVKNKGGGETYKPLPDETVEEEVVDTAITPSDQLEDIIDSQTDTDSDDFQDGDTGDTGDTGGSDNLDDLVDLINPGDDFVGPEQPGGDPVADDKIVLDDDLTYTPFDPDTGTDTDTGTGTTITEDAIQEAINRLFDPNYMAKFQFGKRGMKRGSFRKAFNRKYF